MKDPSLVRQLIDGSTRSLDSTPQDKACVRYIYDAPKFFFDVSAIMGHGGKSGCAAEAIRYAAQLAEVGLFDISFETVVYEWVAERPNGAYSTNILIAWRTLGSIHCRMYTATSTEVDYSADTLILAPETNLLEWRVKPAYVSDDTAFLRKRKAEVIARDSLAEFEQTTAEAHLTAATMLIVCTALLNLGSGIKVTDIPPPKFVNAQRARKGKTPIFGYSLIMVDYNALNVPGQALGGTHASPRVHWRRGHIRTLPSGKKTLVRACLVGLPDGAPLKPSYAVKGVPASVVQERMQTGAGHG